MYVNARSIPFIFVATLLSTEPTETDCVWSVDPGQTSQTELEQKMCKCRISNQDYFPTCSKQFFLLHYGST